MIEGMKIDLLYNVQQYSSPREIKFNQQETILIDGEIEKLK